MTSEFVDALSREMELQNAFLKDREPVYEQVLGLLSDAIRGEFGARLAGIWADRTFHSAYERPLLLLGALRYDALCEGASHPLHAALVEGLVQPDATSSDALAAALSPERPRLERTLRERAVQTNETSRAVTWLWPAHLLATAGERRPIALVDLGASAGLNLVADDLPSLWIDEAETPIPLAPRPPVGLRLGLDVAPLDVGTADDAMWLRACVWPSDHRRLARLEQAFDAFIAGRGRADAPVLEACALGDAPDRLGSLPENTVVLCVQTIVRDYLAPAERERYESGMREFLTRRPPGSALMAELEVDFGDLAVAGQGARLTVRFTTVDGTLSDLVLARTHPHPRQLFTNADAVSTFTDAFRLAGAR